MRGSSSLISKSRVRWKFAFNLFGVEERICGLVCVRERENGEELQARARKMVISNCFVVDWDKAHSYPKMA
jgi:hypothetical protein